MGYNAANQATIERQASLKKLDGHSRTRTRGLALVAEQPSAHPYATIPRGVTWDVFHELLNAVNEVAHTRTNNDGDEVTVYRSPDRGVWPAQGTIAATIGCTTRSVGRAVAWLIRNGFVYERSVTRMKGTSTTCLWVVDLKTESNNFHRVKGRLVAQLDDPAADKLVTGEIERFSRMFSFLHEQSPGDFAAGVHRPPTPQMIADWLTTGAYSPGATKAEVGRDTNETRVRVEEWLTMQGVSGDKAAAALEDFITALKATAKGTHDSYANDLRHAASSGEWKRLIPEPSAPWRIKIAVQKPKLQTRARPDFPAHKFTSEPPL